MGCLVFLIFSFIVVAILAVEQLFSHASMALKRPPINVGEVNVKEEVKKLDAEILEIIKLHTSRFDPNSSGSGRGFIPFSELLKRYEEIHLATLYLKMVPIRPFLEKLPLDAEIDPVVRFLSRKNAPYRLCSVEFLQSVEIFPIHNEPAVLTRKTYEFLRGYKGDREKTDRTQKTGKRPRKQGEEGAGDSEIHYKPGMTKEKKLKYLKEQYRYWYARKNNPETQEQANKMCKKIGEEINRLEASASSRQKI